MLANIILNTLCDAVYYLALAFMHLTFICAGGMSLFCIIGLAHGIYEKVVKDA